MNDSKVVCILGMHRSGTSAIARAVNLLGAYLGEEKDIMAPGPDNPEGYWERNDIVVLHNRIFEHFKRSWDTPLGLPEGWHLSKDSKPFRDELLELVRMNFGDKTLWAWKDPRTSILIDLWKDVVDDLGVALHCLFAVRNPLDVARSLEKRNGFSLDKSFGIWFNYNITALEASRGLPIAFISYDRFFSDWEKELKRCFETLDISWPEDDTVFNVEMRKFIRPELRHSASTVEDLKASGAPEPVVELCGLLFNSLGSKPDEVFYTKVEALTKGFLKYSRFFREDFERVKEKELQLAEKDRLLTEKDRLLNEKDRQIENIYNTWSWKITAPLRGLFKLIRKKSYETYC